MDERKDYLAPLRVWQESRLEAGPFQVPGYEDFARMVQSMEDMAARIEELERERDAIEVHRDVLIKSTADGIRELTEERDNLAAELEKVARLRVLAQRVCTLDATEPRDDLAVRVAIWDLRAALASVQGEDER